MLQSLLEFMGLFLESSTVEIVEGERGKDLFCAFHVVSKRGQDFGAAVECAVALFKQLVCILNRDWIFEQRSLSLQDLLLVAVLLAIKGGALVQENHSDKGLAESCFTVFKTKLQNNFVCLDVLWEADVHNEFPRFSGF